MGEHGWARQAAHLRRATLVGSLGSAGADAACPDSGTQVAHDTQHRPRVPFLLTIQPLKTWVSSGGDVGDTHRRHLSDLSMAIRRHVWRIAQRSADGGPLYCIR